jgi:ABC-type branched-subunit amino acid transport system substrate-binding protein
MRFLARQGRSRSGRVVSGVAVVLVLVASILVGTGFTTHKQAGVIKVAWVGPLSGSFAAASAPTINGIQAYFDVQNKKGGVLGKKLQLLTKDDGFSPANALQAVRDFQGQGVKIFYMQYEYDARATAPLQDGSAIFFTSVPPILPTTDFPYVFNLFPPNKYAMLKNAQFAKRHSLSKVALVTNTTAQFQAYFDAAHDQLPRNNMQIVLEQRYDPATTDFSPIITRIKQSGADVVMVFNVGTEGTRFYAAAAAANLQLPLLGGYGNASSDLSSVPKAFLDKYGYFITTTPFLLDAKTGNPILPKYGALAKDIFYHRYGRKPNVGQGTGWNTPAGMVWGITKAKGDNPAGMKTAFESTARAKAGVAFVAPPIVFHFSKSYHSGYPASQVALAHLFGNAKWPGFYFGAS